MISTTYDHMMAMLIKSGDGDSIFRLEIPSTATQKLLQQP
jgi:hypothetical protein